MRQACDRNGIVAGDRHVGFCLQRAEPRHLLLADQIVADQDVVDPGIGHHFGLTELLAGDALGAGLDLHGGDDRALVGLDMRPVGDPCGIAGRLDPRDVALDPVHVDDGDGRAVFTGDSGGEGCGHRVNSSCASSSLRAKRSNPWRGKVRMDCFVAALLAMTIESIRQFQACSISSRNTSNSSHLSSASCKSFCALVWASEAVSNFLRFFL